MLFIFNLPPAFEIGFRIWWSRFLIPSFSLSFAKFYLHCASCWDVVWGSCRVGIALTFLVHCGALHSFGSSAIMWSWFLQTWRLLNVHIWLRGWRLDVVVLAEVSDVIFVGQDVGVYVFWNVVTQTWNTWSVHKNSVKSDGTVGRRENHRLILPIFCSELGRGCFE